MNFSFKIVESSKTLLEKNYARYDEVLSPSHVVKPIKFKSSFITSTHSTTGRLSW